MIKLPKRHKYHSLADLINMQQLLEGISGNHHGLSFNILKNGQHITTQEALQDATLLQRPTSPANSEKSTQQKEFTNIHDYKSSTKVKRQRQSSKIHYHSYETEDEGWRIFCASKSMNKLSDKGWTILQKTYYLPITPVLLVYLH
ncbi:unnamed protein product [Amoebophrya sp. A25]|nr:unnamed protein product [Amoebophrya sp. A25]|eukprot:GSA25T00024304001.1